MTCVSLPVGRLRRNRLSSPLSRITLSTYLPSGEIAARAALPVFVICVMVNWGRGAGEGGGEREYTRNPAAQSRISIASIPAATPNLRCFAAAMMAELLACEG